MVSVVIPVFNGERYIAEAINSIIQQTYNKIEIIVVDDGSKDNTAEIVKAFNQVRYIYQENQGVSAGRNIGMSVAGGDYLAFLDADDLYIPEKVEKQVDILKNNPDVDVVYNDGIEADKNKRIINILKSECVFENRLDFAAFLLFRQIIPVPASIMIRRKCIEDKIFYNKKYKQAEDYEYIIRLALRYKFKYIPEPLYIYRRHENNLTNAHGLQQQGELSVLRELGLERILEIVEASSFPLPEKRFLLAKIYIKMSEYKPAKQLLTYLAEAFFGDPYLWFYLGNCCYFLGECEEAILNYNMAIQADGNMAEAYNNLACIYADKDNNRAVGLLNKALALRPNYMDAKYNLTQIAIETKNYRITIRELRKELINYRSM